jgi:adenylylsulfate kinase
VKPERKAFAVWVTGLPASGKSTIAAALRDELARAGIDAAVLESDVLRPIFTPGARYQQEDRDAFYRQMAYVGRLLTAHGVPVIFDGTANRRCYRDQARAEMERFMEVYVQCPLEVCQARDPKGLYRNAREGLSSTLPGIHAVYEAPESPDIIVQGDTETPGDAARRIVGLLGEKNFLAGWVEG